MGYKNRTELEINNSSSSSEALLFATMCIIGLPVDVHVKDGSVYSGIFYTASVEKDYGVFFYFFILVYQILSIFVSFVLFNEFLEILSGSILFC